MNKEINIFRKRIKNLEEDLSCFRKIENAKLLVQILNNKNSISSLENIIDIDHLRKEKENSWSANCFLESYDEQKIEKIILDFAVYDGHPKIFNRYIKDRDLFLNFFGSVYSRQKIVLIKRIFKFNKIEPKDFCRTYELDFKDILKMYYGNVELPNEHYSNSERDLVINLCKYFGIKIPESFKDPYKNCRCLICGESYRSEFVLKLHLKENHGIKSED